MSGIYFADSFYWIAISEPRDAWHARTLAWQIVHPNARFLTTEEVLTEVLNWYSGSGPAGRAHAVNVVRTILADSSIQVLPQTSGDFLTALSLYESRPDKDYSLTDCRSMLAMRSLGLSEALTNDHHFAQEGFTVLFPTP